jgi:hypothetical protein
MMERDGRYAVSTAGSSSSAPALVEPVLSIPNIDHRQGDGRAEILGVAVLNEYSEPLHLMLPQSSILVRITMRATVDLSRPVAGFMLRNHLGLDFTDTNTERENQPVGAMTSGEMATIDFALDIPEFYPGAFSFSPFVSDGGVICDSIDNAVTVQMARGEGPVYGYIQLPCRIEAHRSGRHNRYLEPEIA